jgi:hypothetical protein
MSHVRQTTRVRRWGAAIHAPYPKIGLVLGDDVVESGGDGGSKQQEQRDARPSVPLRA